MNNGSNSLLGAYYRSQNSFVFVRFEGVEIIGFTQTFTAGMLFGLKLRTPQIIFVDL